MGIIQLLIILLIIGAVLYVINRPDVKIFGTIKVIINWVGVIVAIVLVLRFLFAITGFHDIKI